MRRSRILSRLVVACSLGVAIACGSAGSNSGFDNGSSGAGSSGSGSGGASGGLGSGSSGGGASGVGNACAAETSKGQQRPLDMYIMLDQSASMDDSGKWPSVTSALKTFFGLPAAAGVGVGLQYFALPATLPGCPSTCARDADCPGGIGCIPLMNKCLLCLGGETSCLAADYERPEIEIAPLPSAGANLTASLDAHKPSSNTPTSAALQGAVNHAKAWGKEHPGHVTVAVLATDGEPSECDTDITNIQAIAATAAADDPKVLTFVVGVGDSLSNLNGIAAAGGTGQAYLVDTSANVTQQFLDALNKIRGAAVGCQYAIPPAKSGASLDYGTVNVQLASGGAAVTIPKVDDASQCPSSGDAWYYDTNGAPSAVVLCDATCKAVAVDATAEVSLAIGCATLLK
jgi:hypothetical protein